MATALDYRGERHERNALRQWGRARLAIPPLEQLLVEGGDDRIALDSATATNRYGCPSRPDAALIAFGSSTASVISAPAFAAAQRLRHRLMRAAVMETPGMTYARELRRIRDELLALCGVDDLAGLETVFAASGTDLHLIAGQLVAGDEQRPGLAVMVDGVETGRCVPTALAGRHFGRRAALGETVSEGEAVSAGSVMEVAAVALRRLDGTPRATDDIDAEVTSLVAAAATHGRRVLLTLVDVSKTGMIAPSPACALALQRRWPQQVEVMVDACQFRIAPATLRGYLDQGCMVALTGSKFVGGPTFSGVLLISAAAAARLRDRLVPRALRDYSLRGDWPSQWAAAAGLSDAANFGLLLRWQAALQELRAFRAVPQAAVSDFIKTFGEVIRARLHDAPAFEALPTPRLEREGVAQETGWDHLQTIFPFVLYRRGANGTARPLDRDETARVYRLLQTDLHTMPDAGQVISDDPNAATRYQLGQPVACGRRDGIAVSALRICVGARLIVEATAEREGAQRIFKTAMAALDKTALLVRARL